MEQLRINTYGSELIEFSVSPDNDVFIFQENGKDSDQNLALLEKENIIKVRDWLNQVINNFNINNENNF